MCEVTTSVIFLFNMDPTTIAVVAIVVAAASEIISYLPIRENGVVQVGVKILKLLFPKR